MFDFSRFKALTFDCYGTLIDWERGILASIRPVLEAHTVSATGDTLLEDYALFESEIQQGAYISYRDVLRQVMERYGQKYGIVLSKEDQEILVTRFDLWKPFPDTVAALKVLKKHFTLNILSNIDDALIAITAPYLEVPFDTIITAEQIGSYKPSHQNFKAVIARLGLPREQILHVAQSLYHDVAPARELGLMSVWVNRRTGKEGGGATVPSDAVPDLEVPDLKTLAALVEEQLSGKSSGS